VCLDDLEKHELVLNTQGQVRVFNNRASARGTRSRLARGLQTLSTASDHASKGTTIEHSATSVADLDIDAWLASNEEREATPMLRPTAHPSECACVFCDPW
jgi:hypothetical protein